MTSGARWGTIRFSERDGAKPSQVQIGPLDAESSHTPRSCGLVEGFKRLSWRFFLRTNVFARGIQAELENFSLFVETDILRRALGEEISEVPLSVEGTGSSARLVTHLTDPPEPLEGTRHIAALMEQIGVEHIRLDPRLEANQFTDVVEMLWALRHRLQHLAQGKESGNCVVADLITRPGRRIACTQTHLDPATHTLSIRYSYCEQVFSRAVTTFKERATNLFKDHRAFFRAAPRFAFIAMVLSGMPYLALAFSPGLGALAYTLIALAACATCGAIAFITYVIFRTIGSIEYDKEQQAWELEQTYKEISRVHRSMQADLDVARAVQRMLIPEPTQAPFPDHVAIATSFRPEMQVGGDYFDFKALDDQTLAVLIADVSGHGMAAAFITGLIKTTFELSGDLRRSPRAFVDALNRRLCEMTPIGSFASLFYGLYDIQTRRLSYTNAGHSPSPMRVGRDGGAVVRLTDNASMVAGIMPDMEYADAEARLDIGDKIVLATDGLSEARDPATNELFGLERFEGVLSETADQTAEETVARLLGEVERFEAGMSPEDDRAVVIVQVLT